MTDPTLIHRTSDGREFEDLERAQAHQALLNKIEKFLTGRCAESGKKRLRLMLVDWTEHNAATVTEYGEVAE